MKEELVKLINSTFAVELNDEEQKEIQDFIDGKITAHDVAWWLVDELELEKRGNRAAMKELLEKFAKDKNIEFKPD